MGKYQKQQWYDLPNTTTPISSDRLNYMEEGIYQASMSGGGGAYIGDDEPTEEGTNLWIKPSEQASAEATNIVNEYTNEETKAYSTKYINECNNYSTEEHFTGKTWEDGNKIYSKVIRQNISNTSGTIDVTNLNINNIVDYKPKIKSGTATTKEFYNNTSDRFRLWFSDNNTIQYRWGAGTSANIECIVEYTKTN